MTQLCKTQFPSETRPARWLKDIFSNNVSAVRQQGHLNHRLITTEVMNIQKSPPKITHL